MKLYLVISLALWQTSNGKYVNEEYEPEEIQDQVFEVSKLYNSISRRYFANVYKYYIQPYIQSCCCGVISYNLYVI